MSREIFRVKISFQVYVFPPSNCPGVLKFFIGRPPHPFIISHFKIDKSIAFTVLSAFRSAAENV
ncbi:MAG: hypothetical protein LBL93_06015, partial [Ruminococcus sp.]|nr:hypothetical protein [Ruminococcus sp.]